jgi:hypothetical protein
MWLYQPDLRDVVGGEAIISSVMVKALALFIYNSPMLWVVILVRSSITQSGQILTIAFTILHTNTYPKTIATGTQRR